LCQKWQCCGSVNSLMAVRSHCKLLHFAYCYEAYVEYLSEHICELARFNRHCLVNDLQKRSP